MRSLGRAFVGVFTALPDILFWLQVRAGRNLYGQKIHPAFLAEYRRAARHRRETH